MHPVTDEQLSEPAPSSLSSLPLLDDSLSSQSILEILLICARSPSAEAVAQDLLERFGSLSGVLAAEPHRLREAHRIDEAAIALLKAVQAAVRRVVREPIEERRLIASRKELANYLSVTMRHEAVEVFRVLFLDSKNGLINDEVIARGTIDHVSLYPREIVRRSLELGASALIMVHNHPSGDPVPSKSDIAMTRKIIDALEMVNVTVHDHIIVGLNKEVSMKNLKLIK